MNNASKIDLLKLTLNRYDSCYGAINNKATFYLTFIIFILGAVIINFDKITGLINNQAILIIIYVSTSILFIGSTYSLYLIIKAILPFLENDTSPSGYSSILFFEIVSKTNIDEYIKKIKTIDEDIFIEDLTRQAHILSKGLNYKFKQIYRSTKSLEYLVLLPLSIILLLILINSIIK